jgi:hypothetical protein
MPLRFAVTGAPLDFVKDEKKFHEKRKNIFAKQKGFFHFSEKQWLEQCYCSSRWI